LLALDTATEHCSAAVWLDGHVCSLSEQRARGHGERILSMIEEVLSQTGTTLRQLDAIAVGRGPGAFTGVRLAVSVAQGLAYAADLPVIPVSNLRALALQALSAPDVRPRDVSRVLICQDARMHEVYWAYFEQRAAAVCAVGAESVSPPQAVRLPSHWQDLAVAGAGSGFAAYAEALAGLRPPLAPIQANLYCRACDIAQLAAEDGLAHAVPAHDAQPVYLREQVAVVPRKAT
jgi:tRNA threonylcarbamoyladenosine biosynthesis protein TsaB